MNNKIMNKKKGFTLVELVIVIAVIAILAGVLIGTFAGVISRANQSKALQEAKAKVDEAYVEFMSTYHVIPESVKVVITNDKLESVAFGLNVKDGTFKDYVVLEDGYVELNKVNNEQVYLVWNKGSYTITTANSGDLLNSIVGTTADN